MMKTPLLKRLSPLLAAAPYRGSRKLVLSVSGGLDSMTLLSVFVALQHVHDAVLEVCHVHHGTGAFADESEALVRRVCGECGVNCRVFTFRGNVQANFEYEAARFRHHRLREMLDDDTHAVLAHHRGDQAETVLMTLTRGAGVATPLGMIGDHDNILRPFLDVPRSALHEHAVQVGLHYLNDPTNQDITRFRNAVRHEVLPVLNRFHGDAERLLAGFASEWQVLRDQLEQAAHHIFKRHYIKDEGLLSRGAFDPERSYLWGFLLRLLWQTLEIDNPIRTHADQLMTWLKANQTGHFQHAGGVIHCDLDGVTWEPEWDQANIQSGQVGESIDWNGWQVRLSGFAPSLVCAKNLEHHGFRVLQSQQQAKGIREYFRGAQIPLRARRNVPDFEIDQQRYSLMTLLTWQKQGLCQLELSGKEASMKLLRTLERYVSEKA